MVGYGEWEFGLGGENGMWRAVRRRSWVGGEWCCMRNGWA